MANPTTLVEPPRRQARRGGLFEVAEVIPGARLVLGADPVYNEEPCDVVFNDLGYCFNGAANPADKTYDGVTIGTAAVAPFGLGYGVDCFIGPGNAEDFHRRASSGLTQAEERAVEARLFTWLDAATAIPVADIETAIAAAEAGADADYLGLPVIHMTRGAAVIAASRDLIYGDGAGNLWTVNGTPVVASSSYGAAGVHSVWVSGGVTVLQGEIVATDVVKTDTNRQQALAERGYSILVDCGYRAEYTVTTP